MSRRKLGRRKRNSVARIQTTKHTGKRTRLSTPPPELAARESGAPEKPLPDHSIKHMRFSSPIPKRLAQEFQPQPLPPDHRGLLHLPVEIRLNVYRYLAFPQGLYLCVGASRTGSNRVRCLSSHQFPLLGTSHLVRKEVLAYLLSELRLVLLDGVRPRLRHNDYPLPLWQICHIQHVSVDLSRKMQFEIFSRLNTLTLLWGNTPLTIAAPPAWRQDLEAYMWSEDGAFAMTELAQSVLKSYSEPWVRHLVARKKKKFQLQLRAIFGCRDQVDAKSKSLISVVVNVDKRRVITRQTQKESKAVVQWWTWR